MQKYLWTSFINYKTQYKEYIICKHKDSCGKSMDIVKKHKNNINNIEYAKNIMVHMEIV